MFNKTDVLHQNYMIVMVVILALPTTLLRINDVSHKKRIENRQTHEINCLLTTTRTEILSDMYGRKFQYVKVKLMCAFYFGNL